MVFKTDRICVWIFIVCLALMSTVNWFGFLDELTCLCLACLAFADCLLNPQRINKYFPIFILIAVLFFYVIYSVIIGSNGIKYILMDFVIQIKSFMAFLIVFAISPSITTTERKILKIICLINIVAMTFLLLMGDYYIDFFVGHIAYCGITIFLNTIIFLFCSVDEEGNLATHHKIVVFVSLLVGLLCGRSKYYAEFLVVVFMLFLYKPGMMRKLNFKYVFMIVALIAVIVFSTWEKFSYYYLTGDSDSFNPEMAHSLARPALYAGAGMILLDYFPLGSGFASFATYASLVSYSETYYEYGLNNVWGLSPNMSDFICDAFYAELAQFGIVGVALFVFFWTWVYKQFKVLTRKLVYKHFFIVGTAALWFIFVECTSGSFFIQTPGVVAMMIIGFVTSIAQQDRELCLKNESKKIIKIKI